MSEKQDYQFYLWLTYEWESDTRYYRAQLQQDLFGHWCIVCSWGGLHNRFGNSKTYYVEDMADADRKLQQIAKRRISHGYRILLTPQ